MKKILFIILLCSCLISVAAQDVDTLWSKYEESSTLPKIGLALSGGAAHGLAHVGVIKYIEELGIPIDYITGTSMGAIVGGLYSMGYNYDEMMDIMGSKDWDAIISNKISLNEVSPFEKELHDKIPIKLRIEQNKILLPKAIFDGHKLDLAIAHIFSPSNLVETFDDLPRPFRCYAVNLLSGQVLEMKDGNLGQSIRASMAIPSVFTPVQIDSMLLVDGGLLKNFPVMENKNMGSDIVIGVYAGSKRSNIEDVKSMVDVLRLTGFLSSLNDTEEQKKITDILVEPDVKDFPLLDFANFEILVEEGYNAARKDSIKFKRLANFFSENSQKREVMPLKLPQKFFIESTNIIGPQSSYSQLLRSRMYKVEKQQVGFDEISEAIEQCFATNNLHTINYSLKEGSLGQILEVEFSELKESSIGISINHFSNTNSALIFQGTLRNIFAPMTNLTGYARLSDNPGIKGRFYRRFGLKKKYIFELGTSIFREKNPVIIDRELEKELLFNKFKIYFAISKEFGDSRLFTFEYGFNNRNLKPQVLDINDIADFDQNHQNLSLSFTSNTLPNLTFPTEGHQFYLSASFLHNLNQEVSFEGNGVSTIGIPPEEKNLQLQFGYRKYLKQSENVIFSYILAAGSYSKESLFNVFQVGGTDNYDYLTLPFIGSDQGEYRYQRYIYARSSVTFPLASNINFSIITNIIRGRSYSPMFIDKTTLPIWETKFGFGASAGVHTLIGPVNIDVGTTKGFSDLAFSVGIGYRFIN